jgi:hypothetical protein
VTGTWSSQSHMRCMSEGCLLFYSVELLENMTVDSCAMEITVTQITPLEII